MYKYQYHSMYHFTKGFLPVRDLSEGLTVKLKCKATIAMHMLTILLLHFKQLQYYLVLVCYKVFQSVILPRCNIKNACSILVCGSKPTCE